MRNLRIEFIELCDEEKIPSYRSPFPVTYYHQTSVISLALLDYLPLNMMISRAHQMIKEDRLSPYLAWSRTLGYSDDQLPSLLKISRKDCDKLIAHSDHSPPPENVLHFCHVVGVHPAYLTPAIDNRWYASHYPMLRAVTRVYKDPQTGMQEREIARICLQSEISKFRSLQIEDMVIYSYLAQAERHVKRYRTKNRDSAAANFDSKTTYSRSIVYKSENPASDIDLAFDDFETESEASILQYYDKLKKAKSDLEKIDNEIVPLSELIYGAEYGEDTIDQIIGLIRDAYVDVDHKWKWSFTPRGYLQCAPVDAASPDACIKEFEDPAFHHDFEVRVRDVKISGYYFGMHPNAVASLFINGVTGYIAKVDYKNQLLETISDLEAGLEKFRQWRNSEDAHYYYIPALANYLLAERALGKQQLALPSPSSENREPVYSTSNVRNQSVAPK